MIYLVAPMFGKGITRDTPYPIKTDNGKDVVIITNDLGVDIIVRLNVPCPYINGYRWVPILKENEDDEDNQ